MSVEAGAACVVIWRACNLSAGPSQIEDYQDVITDVLLACADKFGKAEARAVAVRAVERFFEEVGQ